ncbi:hypothetical protein P175DRAFT_08514 [Aspergillus ochraceoroseus IBT 24754]|uniref:Uncharacterized protein n=1 Tax=Aspergillus ochraceoroseus IBT 24754 TaxID=1392256 RepID=A0A2T5M5R5_9EURO|nr:uncharacterized protein P175DRAFT_08514 [Aspergillus ochraceoroseus IBT 24754]PTU23877.1 hypothetical protein P175DRAFT_08514 [Aspergillus ochraceoroseus IBT 24754]
MRLQIIRSIAILGGISLATANEIVSLLLMDFDSQGIVGEVSGPSTTYNLHCPTDTPSDECGFRPQGQTITVGSDNSFNLVYEYEDYWLKESCSPRGTTWISCEATNTQSDFSTETSTALSTKLTYLPVTITATTTLDHVASSTTGSAAGTSSATGAHATGSSSTASAAVSSNAASNSTSSASATTSTPNAGAPMATGVAAQWVMGGAAAAAVVALVMA